ncbi:MAG TPA: ATP-binding protein [Acidimicrobiia bacterium]
MDGSLVAFFDPIPEAVAAARRFVLQHAGEAGALESERLASVTSELVTNVILHARTPFTVRVRDGDGHVRVTVDDSSPNSIDPDLIGAPADRSGRGLRIVGALSDRWGIDYRPGGKSVWFSVTHPTTGPPQFRLF